MQHASFDQDDDLASCADARADAGEQRTRSVPPGFLMMWMDSRLVLPLQAHDRVHRQLRKVVLVVRQDLAAQRGARDVQQVLSRHKECPSHIDWC